jgi:hypothetical protein
VGIFVGGKVDAEDGTGTEVALAGRTRVGVHVACGAGVGVNSGESDEQAVSESANTMKNNPTNFLIYLSSALTFRHR